MSKYIKVKIISAFIIAVFAVFCTVAAAAEDAPVVISRINIPESVQSGRSFRAEVGVKNNTSDNIGIVKVSTINTSEGIISVTTRDVVEIELGAGAEQTVSFDFNAGSVDTNTIYEIIFTIEYPGNTKSETRRILVNSPPPEPVAPQNPRFERVTEVYPRTVTLGGSARIGFRFANMGGPAYGVTVTINIPEGVEAVKAAVISVGTMLPGQSYDCNFEFKITSEAPTGMQVFTITVASDSGASFTHPMSIRFDKGEEEEETPVGNPNINIVSTDIAESVKKGEQFEIKAVLENSGADSGRIDVTLVLPPNGIANLFLNPIQIDSLKQNSRTEISFVLRANKSAEEDYNQFEIKLEYEITKDDKTEKIQKKQQVGLIVLPDEEEEIVQDFSIEIKIPENVKANEDFAVSVSVKNNGADEKNLYLKIEAPGGVVNKSANNFYMPELKSGETAEYEAIFSASEEISGKYSLFYISLYTRQPGGADVVITDRYAGTTVLTPDAEQTNSKMAIESINAPQNVNIGETFDVEVTIENTGSEQADDITITLGMPTGILNQTAATVKFDSLESGGKATTAFTFIVTQNVDYGYNPFNVEMSYSSASNESGDNINRYFGVTVSSSDLRIESVTIPNSVGINADFEMAVAVKNTGADTTNVILTLSPQGGLIHKSSNTVKIDHIKTDETIVLTFVFMAPESAPDGYAAINIALSHGEDQITQYSGTIVRNPPKKEEEKPPEEDEKFDIPVVIISKFSYENAAVYGGQTFEFSLELLNTNKTVAVKDLKITFSQEHGIFNPKSGSNTFFVEWLSPGQTAEISIPLLVKSDADPDSYGLTVSLSYKSEKGETASSSEIINIPVQQEMRFSIGDLPPINDIELGDEAYVNVQFGNLGKSWIYNVVVRVQGDGFTNMEGTYYAGNIEKGKFMSKEFVLTPYNPGYLNGSFVFTYEDAEENSYEEECPFYFMVIGDEMGDTFFWDGKDDIQFGPDGMPITDDEGDDEKAGGFWLFTEMNLLKWAIIIGGGVLVIAIIVVVIVIIRRKKLKDEDDDDL